MEADHLLFLCADEDDDGERSAVPLTPLASFFSDEDSLREQKRKKPKKMREGKISTVKKRKKEVGSDSLLTRQHSWLAATDKTGGATGAWRSHTGGPLMSEVCFGSWIASVT